MGVFSYLLLLGVASVHAWRLIGERAVSHVSAASQIRVAVLECVPGRFCDPVLPDRTCPGAGERVCSVRVQSRVSGAGSSSALRLLVLRPPESPEPQRTT